MHAADTGDLSKHPSAPDRSENKQPGAVPAQQPGLSRLSRVEAQTMLRRYKRWLVAMTMVAFGILSGLVAGQGAGTLAHQNTPAPAGPATTSPANGSFFQQPQGGYGFGQGHAQHPPVSGSHPS